MNTTPPSRPRVLFLLGAIPLYGMELATIEVACQLRDAGAEVLFVTNAHWDHRAVAPRLDALGIAHRGVLFFGSIERGIGLRRIAIMFWMLYRESRALRRIIDDFAPTHVHVVNHWDYANFMPALRRMRARLVFQAHNAPSVRHPLVAWLWRRLFARADTVVVVSHFLAARYRAIGADPARLAVIYNTPPRRLPQGTTPPALPPRRDGWLHLVCIGQIASHKGVTTLLDAVMRLRARGERVACVFVGSTDNDCAQALIAQAANDDAVHFAGYVDDPTPWLMRADVHVAPSRFDEAFGIVVAEAKQAGRASIVSDAGALPELVTDGVDGTVVPAGDVDALVAAIARYLATPALAKRQGDAARASLATLRLDDVPSQWRALYGIAP